MKSGYSLVRSASSCNIEIGDHSGYGMRDWRKALRTPPTYRIGNRTIRIQTPFLWLVASCCVLLFFIYIIHPATTDHSITASQLNSLIDPAVDVPAFLVNSNNLLYNNTYPLSSPIISNGISTFRIGMIADLDTSSKSNGASNVWRSYLMKGYLSYSPAKKLIDVTWDTSDPIEIQSSFSLKGRGMELSELVVFNGKLLSFDDRTGFIYEIDHEQAIPWVVLMDGNGKSRKGFKAEWATVKDQVLYVGSMGKEWTTSMGDFESNDPMYVKAVTIHGEVYHLNWVKNFKALRYAMGIEFPGYVIHESGVWSAEHKRWFFLPRRCSKERYNETRDEHMGCDVQITADENFKDIEVTKIKEKSETPTHGYSSFKFLPTTNDKIIVALTTEELNGKTSTFISAFTTDGDILLKEEKIPTDFKYEGFEFI